MATIKDIANRLGIAVSTVSKGLNGASDISADMRQLVLDTAVEMGYASKKMKSTGTRKVCIFIENMDYENIEQFGYEIIVGFKLSADWVQQLSKTTVPTVLLDNYIEGNNHVGYVGTDSFEGIDLAVSHLHSLGHTKIAFLNGSKNSMVSEQRQQSFVTSLAKHGIEAKDELMEYGYYVPDCAKYHVPGFINNGATAIMCASDLIATGVCIELQKLGLKVPEDVSVIGFDDLPIASQLSPSLTTIRQDRTDLGKSAFLLLDGLIHNITISKLLLRAKFIQRRNESNKNPPHTSIKIFLISCAKVGIATKNNITA
ncbi:MAG: hypothetical protein K0R00_3607 [Herbinix sp.]|nr:hypothetical protein [Herbinix sp.]